MSTLERLNFRELEPQDVRNYWEHEAHEFTPWLATQLRSEDVSHLEDVLGLDLEVIETEKRVGRYSLDILAEVVDDGRRVVIENQLSSSDHDHLGKTIAYASGVDADIIVWITPRFHDEHRDAIQWLNENSIEGIDLFAIRLEIWKIGNSDPAVRLNPVSEPSEWKVKAQRSEGELSEVEKLQEEYWTEFRDRIEESETPLRPRKPYPEYYYENPIGRSGFYLVFKFNTVDNMLSVDLVIKDDPDAFWQLAEDRDQIDSRFDADLTWNEPEENRAGNERSTITVVKPGDLSTKDRWGEYLDWMLEYGERYHDVFYDRLQSLSDKPTNRYTCLDPDLSCN